MAKYRDREPSRCISSFLETFKTISITLLTKNFRFKVESEGYAIDSMVAWACIRLDRLRQGYRFLTLLDRKGLATEGIFLVKVEKTVY